MYISYRIYLLYTHCTYMEWLVLRCSGQAAVMSCISSMAWTLRTSRRSSGFSVQQ